MTGRLRASRVLQALVCFFLVSRIVAAQTVAPELRKPAPTAETRPFRERLLEILKSRYPQLLLEHVKGVPVLTVLLNSDGTVAHTDLQVLPQVEGTLTATESRFGRFGVREGQLQYIGMAQLNLPFTQARVIFGGLSSQDLDRALIQQYFPKVTQEGVAVGENIWMLFDHDGHVLASGEEPFSALELRPMLEVRYPGIRTSDLSVTPIRGKDGRPLVRANQEAVELYCVWLTPDSPRPSSK